MRYVRRHGNVTIAVCGKRALNNPTGFRIGWNDRSDKNETPPFFGLLAEFARCHRWIARNILTPDISQFNGNVARDSEFKRYYWLEGAGIMLHWDCSADGVVIPPGYTALLSTGDCPTIVAYHLPSQTVVAAHAGLKSLLPGRRVVKNILDCFGPDIHTKEIQVRVICSIAPERFVYSPHDSRYGKENRMIIAALQAMDEDSVNENGEIDLYHLACTELTRQGVPPRNIESDCLDTFSDPDLWSHVAGDRGRNGIFVINRENQAPDS